MRVRGLEQQWWRVDPHVSKELAPQSWKGIQQRHPPTHMDRPSGLYTESERAEWATLQAVPVYQEMIRNNIEIGSCPAVSQCPTALADSTAAGFNLGLLHQEIPGYSWFAALTNPSNWITASSLLLASISIVLHLIQRCRQGVQAGKTESSTAVGVTINNTPDPVIQEDRVVTAGPMIAAPRYGIANVTEAIEMSPVPHPPGQYGLPNVFVK